jgi:antitoxin component YwqK of YwqJK toxin-antitoxin module
MNPIVKISSAFFGLSFFCASCGEKVILQVVQNGKYLDSVYLDQDSLPHGSSRTYYEDKLIQQSYYSHGLKDSAETIYSLGDSVINYRTYRDGKLLTDRKVAENGRLIYEFTYKYITQDTVTVKKWYSQNSRLEIIQNISSISGVMTYGRYDENGKLMESGDYLYREVFGPPEFEWLDNVRSLAIIKEQLGAKHGAWLYYHPNGTLEHKEVYNHGKETGIWYYFDSTGTLIREKDFDKN